MNTVVTARLSTQAFEGLEELGNLFNKKRGAILREALDFYLSERADYQIALKRLNDHTDEIIDGDEFKAQMNKEHGWKLDV